MRHILAFLVLCSFLTSSAGALAEDSLLRSLDEMVGNKYQLAAERRKAIAEARKEYDDATTDLARYEALRNLYENYRVYRIDSAIIIADRRLELARAMGTPSKIASATLNLADGYVKSGAPDLAIAILDTLSPTSIEDYHVKYLTSVYRNAYEVKAETALLGSDRVKALDRVRQLRDNAIKESNKDSRGYYTLQAEKLHDAGMYAEAVSKFEEAAARFDFSNDAAMLYKMGEMYLDAGNTEKAVNSLTRSAMLDIAAGTKEYRSLILLSSILFKQGDLHRAFDYINCALEDADFSHANIRTAQIMKNMPDIDKAFHDSERHINEQNRKLLIFAVFLVLLLLISLILMIFAFKTKRNMIATIEKFNRELAEKNEALKRDDSLKLRHINTLMLAYADYISRLRDFRKTIYRLLVTSQYEKAMDAVSSDKAEARDITVFHAMFDEAFLSMFPDFVDEVNKYMETPIVMRTAGRLTAELRVIAMMKLGMTSTDEIAGMLHYSSQTVYNLRSTIRAMLKTPWDDFQAYLSKG